MYNEFEVMQVIIRALTGAGISKASNIPTFEEMGDLRDKLSRSYFNTQPRDFYDTLLDMKDRIDVAEPNAAHLALSKYKIPIITMNIDSLHHKAGSQDKDVIEIHGNLRIVYCPRCNSQYPLEVTRESMTCTKCNKGILHPDVVLYGDTIPRLAEALDSLQETDLLLVVGTSFYTSTAHYIHDAAQSKGAEIITINEKAEEQVPSLLSKLMEGAR